MKTTTTLPTGEQLPTLGLGTWHMGETTRQRATEVGAVRLAIELGYRLFDTAEMYGEGGAEDMLGQAIGGALRAGDVSREQLFVVSKVYPHNASRRGVQAACERSRKRLGLDRIDLYLLHWRGQHALAETVAAFEALGAAGHIRHWGVSNFDREDMDELVRVAGGKACAANQVYYSPSERGAEFELLPWLRQRSMPLMAYCPIDQGALAADATLARIGQRLGASASQVALAWVCSQAGVIAIPKAVREAHLRENLAAQALVLGAADRAELEARFRPPTAKRPLAML